MDNNKHIVILGAGYAGVHAAKKLAKKYKKNDSVQITLIDKNPFHTLMTELHEVAGGRVHPESVQVELSKIFHRTKVRVVVDYITKVDVETQTVLTKNDSFKYDYLLIGTGSEPAFFGVPGVKENGFTLWSFEDAIRLRKHIQDTFQRASYESDPVKRKTMLSFVVAGSGFTGIEMAGELLEWKTKLAKNYGIDKEEVSLYVVEALGTILNMLDRKQADKAENYMAKHGVKVLKNSPIVEVTPKEIVLKSGDKIATETLIWTCGIQANNQVAEYGLDRARAGRLQANEYMQVVGHDNVFAIGDLAYYEEEPGKGTPQIVEAAEQTAMTAVDTIVADINETEKKEFKSDYHGFMVSVGGRYGVANLSGIKLSGFFALVMKHLVNMYYLFGVNGIHAVYHYLQHEFFTIEDKRSIMRGHLSSKSNRLWLVPLRLYIGILWFLEGFEKLVGTANWEKADGLKKFVAGIGEDSWIRMGNVKMPFSWLAVDGASGASEAASGASEGAEAAAEWATPILEKMPKLYSDLMEFMIPNAEIAVWFQRMVVVMEIAIGLALIGGLFTFIASGVSAFLVVNFVLSAMAGWEILWYFFGAIALMGGAGRTFGLDYFVMPWINDKVRGWWYGDKVAPYNQK